MSLSPVMPSAKKPGNFVVNLVVNSPLIRPAGHLLPASRL
jgi:hypothetical protein